MDEWSATNGNTPLCDKKTEEPFDAALFLDAQKYSYDTALREISSGRKQSHWIWYIFPQLAGLGSSGLAERYAIRNLEQARAYLREPLLRERLIGISQALLMQEGSIRSILPYPDHLKVCSCMTLFREADPAIPVFQQVLDKFYEGEPDRLSLNILYPKDTVCSSRHQIG